MSSIPCEEDMVPMEFDCLCVCSLSGDNARVVEDEVATDCDPCLLGFFFLWAHGADNPWKGCCSAFGDLVFVDEEDGVGAFDSVPDALG